ncbi:unnamed protein product, partial [Meganyctiphanes norvegica]
VSCGGCHTMVIGLRKIEGINGLSNTQYEGNNMENSAISSVARARRRMQEGVLPPLKGMGLPPMKHNVLPTVPDDEHQQQSDLDIKEENKDEQNSLVNGEQEQSPDANNLDADTIDEKTNTEEENSAQLPKKEGRLSRFFSGLRKKKSSQALIATNELKN